MADSHHACVALQCQSMLPCSCICCCCLLAVQDEELEHMAWQLDKRTHGEDGSAAAAPSNHKGSKHKHHRLVFHDRSSTKSSKQHANNHHRHRRHTQHPHISRSDSNFSDSRGADEQASAAGGVTHDSNSSSSITGSLQQQVDAWEGHIKDEEVADEEQFYCLQLGHSAAGQDLHKAQERMARHIQQVRPVALLLQPASQSAASQPATNQPSSCSAERCSLRVIC